MYWLKNIVAYYNLPFLRKNIIGWYHWENDKIHLTKFLKKVLNIRRYSIHKLNLVDF